MLPFWVRFWDQFSLLLQYEILRNLWHLCKNIIVRSICVFSVPLKSEPFCNWTAVGYWNTRLVEYLDPHCTFASHLCQFIFSFFLNQVKNLNNLKIVHSGDLKSYYSKSRNIWNPDFLKIRNSIGLVSYHHSYSPNHLKSRPFKIRTITCQMFFDKMASICLDFTGLGSQVSDLIENMEHLQTNLFLTIGNPD